MAETVQGLKELADALRALGPDISRNALRAGVRAAAQLTKKAAEANVQKGGSDFPSVRTGTLKRAIYIKQIRELSGNNQQTFFVAARSGKKNQKRGQDAYYWRFLEFGTAKMSAKPFIRPAFEANKVASVDAIAAKIKQRIDKAQTR